MINTYERITRIDGNTNLYMIIAETPILLYAKKVDKEGNEREDHYKGETLVEIVHMIDLALIKKRTKMTMDLKYGELIPEKKVKI